MDNATKYRKDQVKELREMGFIQVYYDKLDTTEEYIRGKGIKFTTKCGIDTATITIRREKDER